RGTVVVAVHGPRTPDQVAMDRERTKTVDGMGIEIADFRIAHGHLEADRAGERRTDARRRLPHPPGGIGARADPGNVAARGKAAHSAILQSVGRLDPWKEVAAVRRIASVHCGQFYGCPGYRCGLSAVDDQKRSL